VATLLIHIDEIVAEFKAAFADRVITAREAMTLAGTIVEAAKCAYEKLVDKTQFGALVAEAEELYDRLVDAENFDIPRCPEFAEKLAVSLGRQAIRPALERLATAIDEVL
jgi:enoyl-CoA hydratase/carnithine racemase